MTNLLQENPFTVQTPEEMSAKDAEALFVDVFTDFEKLHHVGHTFVNGPRGSGKSMMFRFMQPDCQCLHKKVPLHKLRYFGAYVPIKNMGTSVTELTRLEGHAANYVFNEHVLCVYIIVKILGFLIEDKVDFLEAKQKESELIHYYRDIFQRQLRVCGQKQVETKTPTIRTAKNLFTLMHQDLKTLVEANNATLKQLAFSKDNIEKYSGPLFRYDDFLLPLLRGFKSDLSFMPKGHIFLLLDDADNLNLAQTKILNSWVSTRTHNDVSIKVSTQLKYKTFLTVAGQSISTPHDFSEINISTIYTSDRTKYVKRVKAIVEKRLNNVGLRITAKRFFPEDQKQAEAINQLKIRLREQWESGGGRGFRARDDVTRYARPEFIKSLGGTRKSTSSYSYSGFEQLVHISSGIVRFFLEPASQMYSEQKSRNTSPNSPIYEIQPGIQDYYSRKLADQFLYLEMDRLKRDPEITAEKLNTLDKLGNLILAMGGTFQAIMDDSEKAERRVFSIAFSDQPDNDILDVLHLGVAEGYLHESTIGNKEGTGRTRLFIMSRRLAPCFNLDPTSFAGYLFVTSERIEQAMHNPNKYLRDLTKTAIDKFFEQKQLRLFEE
jgi:hypothetical protein